jgi:hypothetical protein
MMIRANLNFLTFLAGFVLLSASLAAHSWQIASAVDGLILMGVAVYPFIRKGDPRGSA